MMTETVTLSRQEYEDLVDGRDHAVAMRDVASGAMPTLTEAELDAYLAAPSAMAYWRSRRGLSQAKLAAAAGIAEAALNRIEAGGTVDDVRLYARLAKALRLRIEDLLPDDPAEG